MRKKVPGTIPYFGDREEQAVIDYNNSNSAYEKDMIYNTILKEPFRIMSETILRTYPIHIGNYSMSEVEENALTHLIENMITFDPNRIGKSGFKTKAFSYCQTIVRNYYRKHGKDTYKDKMTNLHYDDFSESLNEDIEHSYELELETNNHLDILIKSVIVKIEEMINDTSIEIKRNEIIVGDAIINILKNWHLLFLEDTCEGAYQKRVTNKFAKNKILLFLKEQTNLSSKEIRIAMKPFKDLYFLNKMEILED